METWTKTCGLPLLFNFEPHPCVASFREEAGASAAPPWCCLAWGSVKARTALTRTLRATQVNHDLLQVNHPGPSNKSSWTLKQIILDSQTNHPGLSNKSSWTLKQIILDPQTNHPGLSNKSSWTLKQIILDSQTNHPGLSNKSSWTLKQIILDSQTNHPGLSNKSSWTLKQIILDSQTNHPGPSNKSSWTLKQIILDSQTNHPGLSNKSSWTLKQIILDPQTAQKPWPLPKSYQEMSGFVFHSQTLRSASASRKPMGHPQKRGGFGGGLGSQNLPGWAQNKYRKRERAGEEWDHTRGVCTPRCFWVVCGSRTRIPWYLVAYPFNSRVPYH